MALDPRDFFARTQEDKAAGVDPRDFFARTQEDKAPAAAADVLRAQTWM
ncbi:MAG: hypothetical protein O7D34_02255 [Ignavibacteria bacterium]|nr:hypothetical protein [Ignavibacteria bacterium]